MTSTSRHVWVPFAAIVVAMLPAVLDQTILASALPTIAADLGSLEDVSWVVTGYVVAAAAATPLWGKLGDRHGHKPMLEAALALFLLASALCGAAQDVTTLVIARALQGAAAGGLMTVAMAAVGDLVAPRERARFQGHIMAAFAVATVGGPVAGGVLVDHASWRWVFYVNLPLGLLALAALHARLPDGARAPLARRPPLDVAGATLLAGATAAITLACVWGGRRYAWGSPEVVALLAGAAVMTAALIGCERRAADAIVPFDLLASRTVAVASAALFLTVATMFAVTVFVPLYLQVATGASPTSAGLLLVPMMVGVTVATNVVGRRVARTGRYRRLPPAGLALMTGALGTLAAIAGTRSQPLVALVLAVYGVGFGMVGQVLTVAVQDAVHRTRLGMAMATTNVFRGLGGAIGAAALGAVFATAAGGGGAGRDEVVAGVQTVFAVATPVAALALLVALALRATAEARA